MNPKNKLAPLFEAQLELLDPDMVFVPSLEPNDDNSFTKLLNSIINDILKVSSLVERIDKQKTESYEQQIVNNEEVIEMKEEILAGIEKVCNIKDLKYFKKRCSSITHQVIFTIATNESSIPNKFFGYNV